MITRTSLRSSTSLLDPYIIPFTSSAASSHYNLALITHTISATPTWLVREFVTRFLSDEEGQGNTAVVLVSFLRGADSWKGLGGAEGNGETRSGGGVGNAPVNPRIPNPRAHPALATSKFQRFIYVDGLSDLFLPPAGQQPRPRQQATKTLRWQGNLDDLSRDILSVIANAKGRNPGDEDCRVLLVLDGVDFLMSATGADETAIEGWMLGLRESAHTTLLTLSADSAFLHPGNTPTHLELSHSTLCITVAHQAHTVFQMRGLDTGVARDVTGVVRFCRGGGWEEDEDGDELKIRKTENVAEGMEFLFYLAGDGGVKVFGRGEGIM